MKTYFLLLILTHTTIFGEVKKLTEKQCSDYGGKVVNSLSGQCPKGETLLGSLKDMRCRCLCCANSDSLKNQLMRDKNPPLKSSKTKKAL